MVVAGDISACGDHGIGWDLAIRPLTEDAFQARGTSLTQTGLFVALPNMKLVPGLMANSKIRFIEYQPPEGEVLDAHELFSDEVFHHRKEILERFQLNFEIDNGYCGIEQYLEEIWEEKGKNNPKCLVGENFSTC